MMNAASDIEGPDPVPITNSQCTDLATYLEANWRIPEEYIAEKFKIYDIVLLVEDHAIRHNLLLVKNLLPRLHQAGVYNLGMEFGAAEDQDALDRLTTAEAYDEDLARGLMFHYNVGWAYKEYTDLYRAAWELNRSLPGTAPKFRMLNLSYVYDWSQAGLVRTPTSARRVFYKGSTEVHRAAVTQREV